MKLESLKPGTTVFDVARGKMGNTTISTVRVWRVDIISIDLVTRSVIARWNSNREQSFSERQVKRWRKSKPMLIVMASGAIRLARREELKKNKVSP